MLKVKKLVAAVALSVLVAGVSFVGAAPTSASVPTSKASVASIQPSALHLSLKKLTASEIKKKEESAAVKRILADTNAARKKAKLKPLILNTDIQKVAQDWSKRMATKGKLYHSNVYADLMPEGWWGAAENIAYAYSYKSVTAGWMRSPGHKANILDKKATHIGIGYYVGKNGTAWYTQNFGYYPPNDQFSQVSVAKVKFSTPRSTTASSLRISWKKPAVKGKLINYTVTVKLKGKIVKSTTTTALTQKITGLAKNKTYAVSVKANAKSKNKVYSKTSPDSTISLKTK